MYAEERQRAIADQVRAHGRASVTALADRFDVTSETVRRDLAVLERSGSVQRVPGGAVKAGTVEVVNELGLAQRESSHTAEKAAIARAAIRFLPSDGGSVIFDAGTTTYQAAKLLPADRRLTVISTSLQLGQALTAHERATLLMVGGRVRGLTQAAVGAETVAALGKMRASVAFVGTNGISEGHGLSTPDAEEASVKSAIVAAAQRVVVLADSSKMGREDFSSFAPLDEVDVLITDDGIDPEFSAALSAHGIEVVIA